MHCKLCTAHYAQSTMHKALCTFPIYFKEFNFSQPGLQPSINQLYSYRHIALQINFAFIKGWS